MCLYVCQPSDEKNKSDLMKNSETLIVEYWEPLARSMWDQGFQEFQ